MNTDYLFPWQKERYLSWDGIPFPKKEKLSVKVIEQGYLLPSKDFRKRIFGDGCVLDHAGNPVPESYLLVGKRWLNRDGYNIDKIRSGGGYDISSENVQEIHENVIYLGCATNHWGHFLVDGTIRLWYALKNPGIKVAFLVKYGETSFAFIKNIQRFLELAGIKKDDIIFFIYKVITLVIQLKSQFYTNQPSFLFIIN